MRWERNYWNVSGREGEMKQTRARTMRVGTEGRLQFTPMIDVIFLLLIFFLLAMKPVDLLSRLSVDRAGREGPVSPDPALSIVVTPDGYLVGGRSLDLEALDGSLGVAARYSDDVGIAVRSQSGAAHGRLIQLLDVCAKHKLNRIVLADGM